MPVVGEVVYFGVGVPRRHGVLRHGFLDRLGPGTGFLIGAERHRPRFTRPVALQASGIKDRRDVLGKGRRVGRKRGRGQGEETGGDGGHFHTVINLTWLLLGFWDGTSDSATPGSMTRLRKRSPRPMILAADSRVRYLRSQPDYPQVPALTCGVITPGVSQGKPADRRIDVSGADDTPWRPSTARRVAEWSAGEHGHRLTLTLNDVAHCGINGRAGS